LAAITMSFAAFTSALIVRQGSASDWQHFTLPPILYLNSSDHYCQQRHPGNIAPPDRDLYGQL